MERKTSTHYFLIGFVLAAALVGWWLWQRRQEEQAAFTPGQRRQEEQAAFTPEQRRSPAPPAEAPADPLEEIRGIGDVYARRLQAAGIRTFADLAALTPDEARALAQAQPWQADTADWIEQARVLANAS